MTRALAFLREPHPPDYGSRLSRLRWRRAAGAVDAVEWEPRAPARGALAGAEAWLVVRDPAALPAPGRIPEAPVGGVLLARSAVPADPPFVHTLRELEGARLRSGDTRTEPAGAVALAFRSIDFPASADETIEIFIERLLRFDPTGTLDSAFWALPFEDASVRERPELTRRLPGGPLRILDVGCGSGGAVASAKRQNPAWTVTGIERDPRLAASARERCDRVLEGDLRQILPRLAALERFDVLVYADVLEHLDDPVGALREGRALAAPGGMLAVSVPNAGHLSLVRDLLLGRFDPIAAGLMDAGHLRWFTRASLREALEESGWSVVSIAGEPGAPPPEPEAFLALAATWPDCDRQSLMTYQWIAVGRAD